MRGRYGSERRPGEVEAHRATDDIERPTFDLLQNPSDVFAQDTEREKLAADHEPAQAARAVHPAAEPAPSP